MRESPGRAGRTCWRGDLSAVRPELSVEDMLARRGRGAAPGLGSLAGRLRGPRWSWGLLARARRRAGIQAGGVGRGGAAACARRGCGHRAAPPAGESPRVRFKLLSNSQANLQSESRGGRSGTLLPPPSLPNLGSRGALKGPVASARGQPRRERAPILLPEAFRAGSPLEPHSLPNTMAKVGNPNLERWNAQDS